MWTGKTGADSSTKFYLKVMMFVWDIATKGPDVNDGYVSILHQRFAVDFNLN